MRFLRFVVAAVLVVAAAPVARADDPQGLLAKHQAFTGWKFLDPAMQSLTETQTIVDAGGKTVETDRIARIGAAYRNDTHIVKSNTDSSDGFTGRLFWYSDPNGFTVPVIGNAARTNLAEDLFFSDAVAALPWSVAGTKRLWNKTVDVVRVHQENAGDMDLYVDPDTGAYAGIEIDPTGQNDETIRVLAYGDAASGKKIITRWQYDGGTHTRVIGDVKTDANIAPDTLHPPAPSAHWQFSNSTPFPITLEHERIIVKAKVNGVQGTFMLDSGASNIFLSGAFARRAGLNATGHSEAYTLYGSDKTDVGQASSIEIGGNVLNDVTLYFGQAEFDANAPDGLLGFDLLAGAFVTVDFEHATMQIQDPQAVIDGTVPGVHVGVELSDGTPSAPMDIQKKSVTVDTTFDTGSPEFVLIPWDLPENYGLHFSLPSGSHGCGQLDDMSLGPIVYETPSACTDDALSGRTALVGLDFLKGLGKLHFDYSHALVIMTPRNVK